MATTTVEQEWAATSWDACRVFVAALVKGHTWPNLPAAVALAKVVVEARPGLTVRWVEDGKVDDGVTAAVAAAEVAIANGHANHVVERALSV